jgi:hypothetical protein
MFIALTLKLIICCVILLCWYCGRCPGGLHPCDRSVGRIEASFEEPVEEAKTSSKQSEKAAKVEESEKDETKDESGKDRKEEKVDTEDELLAARFCVWLKLCSFTFRRRGNAKCQCQRREK